MGLPLFSVRGLTKRYGGRAVLDGLDFDVGRGECFVILGRSGSGKSVTLRQMVGLDRPDGGQVVFDGTDLGPLGERELLPLRRRVSMLFQSGALFDSMTVAENIAFPMREVGDFAEETIAGRVRDKLEQVGLPGVEAKMPADLSGGMRKRVALARAIALDPEAVLFDEPTTGLDPMTSATIGELIRRATRQLGATAVVVTHDLALARRVADRIAFLDGGRFRFVGDQEALDRCEDTMVRRFFAAEPEDDDAA
jgi:phospholipid/cholesterol/gamma-HCH transport system ATP-binding protein